MKMPANWTERARDVLFNRKRGLLVQIKRGASGMRDLNAALLQLAVLTREVDGRARGVLAIHVTRASLRAVRDAWDRAKTVLDPALAARLFVAVRSGDERWSDAPNDFDEILDAVGDLSSETEPTRSSAFAEIAKVLLEAWLSRSGPVRVQTIMARVGCSAPTAAAALRELENRGEIERPRNRSAELKRMPRRTLDELVIRADDLRRTRWFVDRTGKTNVSLLVKRIMETKLDGFALGGVVAAHHYDPKFDLQGLPRVDLTMHRRARVDPLVLLRIDPALAEVRSPTAEPIIAVHSLSRTEPLFEPQAHGMAYADRAEVLLDLYELHLGAQAAEFVRHSTKG